MILKSVVSVLANLVHTYLLVKHASNHRLLAKISTHIFVSKISTHTFASKITAHTFAGKQSKKRNFDRSSSNNSGRSSSVFEKS